MSSGIVSNPRKLKNHNKKSQISPKPLPKWGSSQWEFPTYPKGHKDALKSAPLYKVKLVSQKM